MAIALKIRVFDLFPEFPAHAKIVRRPLSAAGAIAAGPFQAFPHGPDHFFVFVFVYLHVCCLISVFSIIVYQFFEKSKAFG